MTIALVLLYLLILISAVYLTIKYTYSVDPFLKRAKRAMNNIGTLTSNDLKIIDEYSYNRHDPTPHEKFTNWNTNDKVLEELCKFGFKLLENYASNDGPEKYLEISTDIILRIDRVLYELLSFKPEKSKKSDKGNKTNKWQFDWYTFSVYVPRLMLMYEYIGKNNCIKEFVCHAIITKLITALNVSLNIQKSGIDIVKISIPRLFSNYLYDVETFKTEFDSEPFRELYNIYNITYNKSDKLTNGVYEDGSCIFQQNVATFSNLFALSGFYENVYAAFNVKYNLREVVVKILKKLLHPTIPYVTLGLYGRDGERVSKKWWNVQGKYGIAIMPFIGLGVIKTSKFMFSLRVQRPDIAACQAEGKNKGEFALGWIQLRKMYLADRQYTNPLKWDTLKMEPGIISIVGSSSYIPLTSDKVKSEFCQNVESLIGRVPQNDILFWINKYKFSQYYDCYVIEMGIATDNGVEINYSIDNKSENQLQFRVKDDENKDDLLIEAETTGDNGFITINSKAAVRFTLRMIFNRIKNTTIIKNDNMTFHHDDKQYVVSPKSDNKYFVVEVYDDKNTLLDTFGGSCKSEPGDTMHHNGHELIRDPVSHMYIKK